MERKGHRAAASVVGIPALVPLSSREEEARFWYDAGDDGPCRFSADDASIVFGFDCFACDNDRTDITWSGVELRSGH